jgi:hypothetical protein
MKKTETTEMQKLQRKRYLHKWTKKMRSGKEALIRRTQERKYEAESTSKKDNENDKSEGIIPIGT